MRTYCDSHHDWHLGIPLLLFAIRDTVQEALGFSPFELIFGHEVRGPLKLMKEKWLDDTEPTQQNLLDYVSKFKERLHEVGETAKENLKEAQARMKSRFDLNAQAQVFDPGGRQNLIADCLSRSPDWSD